LIGKSNKELYDEYNRSHRKIKRNDKRFFDHEIQFSTLEDEDNESGDGEIFETLIHDNVNEEDYVVKIGISQQGGARKNKKIIKKLKKFLKRKRGRRRTRRW